MVDLALDVRVRDARWLSIIRALRWTSLTIILILRVSMPCFTIESCICQKS